MQMMELADNTLEQLNKKTDHAEIYMEQAETLDVNIQNDEINYAEEQKILGIGIRVIKDQKQGYAYTTQIKNVENTINQAIKNAKLNTKDENNCLPEKTTEYPIIKNQNDQKTRETDLEEIIDLTKILIDTTKEQKCNPTAGGFASVNSHKLILNTNNISIEEKQTRCSASIEVNTPDNETISNAYHYDTQIALKNINPFKIAENACKLALDSRSPKKIETQDLPVILDYEASASLLGTFMAALTSENKQRQRSIFKDKENQQVTTEEFTLYDDGTMPNALKTSVSDDEGIPSQKTVLIKDGVLKNFIYDTYHAKKENKISTANAVRNSYTSTPSLGFTNLQLNFKETTPINSISEGLIINNVIGAHTANPITGDFSVEVSNAFKIENGERTYPIKKAMISGNIFDIMKTTTKATKTTRQLSSYITPKILIKKIRVIG